MFHHSLKFNQRSVRRFAATVFAACCIVPIATVDTVAAGDGVRTNPKTEPIAGAPDYLHFGPWGGLCTHLFPKWVEDREIVAAHGILYIRGDRTDETFIDISVDDQGTSTQWDDVLVVDLNVYSGPDFADTFTMPYWKPSNSSETGGWTTENVPKHRSVGFIYYSGSSDVKNALSNSTAMPMRANGWFGVLASGDDGFSGGSGPDCVVGSNNDDRVFTRGGSDYVRTRNGDDLILLGDGNDTADAGSDDDTIRGGRGNDDIRGARGNDCYDGDRSGREDVDNGDDILDDRDAAFSEVNSYTVDLVGADFITEASPMMVNACM